MLGRVCGLDLRSGERQASACQREILRIEVVAVGLHCLPDDERRLVAREPTIAIDQSFEHM
jgi:hypothetical protein